MISDFYISMLKLVCVYYLLNILTSLGRVTFVNVKDVSANSHRRQILNLWRQVFVLKKKS